MSYKKIISIIIVCLSLSIITKAQDDLLSGVEKNDNKKEYVNNAFKSSRVINGHSMEFIGKGVMDVRILHRFGYVNTGFQELFGLDQASMRMGFDYGLSKDLTIGIGRTGSPTNKEFDGFIKYRPIQQSVGGKSPSPVSVVLVSGITILGDKLEFSGKKVAFVDRMAYYNEIIVGRKFSENFSAQLAPTHVHTNLVKRASYTNDFFALGIGARYKLSKRTAFVVDYHYLVKDEESSQFEKMKNPLAIGFDIETGGHVFQLHFSNSNGMNEKAFITNTVHTWGKGEVSFGFNLSRVFTVSHKKI